MSLSLWGFRFYPELVSRRNGSVARMEKTGRLVEVLGVPDLFPDDVTSDKLHIYFLRKKHGGGDVVKVLYPCYHPGQAFVMFEQSEGK